MTDVMGNPEEERRTDFYQAPWMPEAVGRYIYSKVSKYRDYFSSTYLQYLLLLVKLTPHPSLLQLQQRRQELEQVLGIRLT